MTPLIDGDLVQYEIGFGSQESIEGVVTPRSWEFCQDLLEKRISLICDEVGATNPPILFLTNNKNLNKILNKTEGKELPFTDNFRFEVAKEKPYKGGRKEDKPFHHKNLLAFMLANYQCVVNRDGLEADDQMCIHQYARVKEGVFDTIICSRDKDLRMCPGLHFSWELGKQASVGPLLVEELGFLKQINPKKVFGVGAKFFYYQLLTGDTVDNIGGIKGCGPAFAFKLLNNAVSIRQCYELVSEVYIRHHGDDWKTKFREQADLLWMVREINEQGERVRWTPPEKLD